MFSLDRPYKSCQPVQTISKIRNILADFDTMLYETFWGNPHEDIYSVRIETDTPDGSFGTNGKGRNRLYTLASAYAEFIERLQNGMLFYSRNIPRLLINQIAGKTGFNFQPDEKFITENEFKNLPDAFLRDLFGQNKDTEKLIEKYFHRLKENKYPGCLAVPFFHIKNREIIYLPYFLTQFITGSNGMAAGNTLEEALFQGLCEILERYAASRVFFNQLTPPTVPRAFLMDFEKEYNIIQTIETETGYEVIIKDFSCGQKLPVIGVLIIDRQRGKYKLNVGADTSFMVALSRALTEIYQGYNTEQDFEKRMLEIPLAADELYSKTNDEQSFQNLKDRFREFTKDGSGIFPQSLFAEPATYDFDPGTFTVRDSYESEVCYLTNLIMELGYQVYVRDVSFLGFPAVYIYVTTISLLGKKDAYLNFDIRHIEQAVELDSVEDMFFSLNTISDENLRKLTAIFDSLVDGSQHIIEMKNVIKLEFNASSDWETIPASFFLVLFWYRLGDLDRTIGYLKKYMDETGNNETGYYLTILHFLESLKQGEDLKDIAFSLICRGANPEEVNEVEDFLADKNRLFDNIKLPACPDCLQCPLNPECLTRHKLNFAFRFQQKMKEKTILQEQFTEVFYKNYP